MLFKRLFDFVMSLFGLIVLLPVFAVIAVLIKIRMPGPVLFKQKRVGKDARLFLMYKFRTMSVNHGGSTISVKGESRITPLGAIMRKYKLDELPEFWNILKGDMSFVGPRPALFNQDDLVELRTKKGVQKLLPGVTGWAQVNGRDDLPIPVKVSFDEYYFNRHSFALDLYIILLTAIKVIKTEGVNH